MVDVATTLEAPIKLLWPRSVLSFLSILPSTTGKSPNMLLGLGDVVIPGTLVALAHRLDMHMAEKRWKEATTKGGNKSGASYFRATLVGYAVGLSMAFGAMHVFKAAQPALLYLRSARSLIFFFEVVLTVILLDICVAQRAVFRLFSLLCGGASLGMCGVGRTALRKRKGQRKN